MRKWYPWLLVAVAFAFSAAVYSRLPEEIATHWNARGEPDGFSSRFWGAFLMPTVLVGMGILLPLLPTLDPRRANFAKFQPTYDLIRHGVMTLITVLHVAVLGAALGWPVPIERVTPLLVGALFVLIGNVMPRARPNWFVGIRTPWTLSNDRVWERTHRLGGVTFVIAGLVLIAGAFLQPSLAMGAFIAAIVVASIVPVVYSYVVWKQESVRAQDS